MPAYSSLHIIGVVSIALPGCIARQLYAACVQLNQVCHSYITALVTHAADVRFGSLQATAHESRSAKHVAKSIAVGRRHACARLRTYWQASCQSMASIRYAVYVRPQPTISATRGHAVCVHGAAASNFNSKWQRGQVKDDMIDACHATPRRVSKSSRALEVQVPQAY